MITFKFKKSVSDNWVEFEVSGHANSAPYGQDIVCAGASAATFMTINSIPPGTVDWVMEEGHAKATMLQITNVSQILIQALYEFACEMEKEYGEEYVKVECHG